MKTNNLSFKEHILKILEYEQAISISRLMQEWMYNPKYGYYFKKDNFKNDFITAPELSQTFGEILAIWLIYNWQKIGSPKEFILTELGPGFGTLMQDILRTWNQCMPVTLQSCMKEIYMVENSPHLIAAQKEKLNLHSNKKITWVESISEIKTTLPIIWIANEFFDCLPIKQYIYDENEWYERLLSNNGKNFVFINHKINKPILKKFLYKQYGDNLANKTCIEYSDPSYSIMNYMLSHIKSYNGLALIIDYGYNSLLPPEDLKTGTLQIIKNHSLANILDHLGEADISAHVNFMLFQLIANQHDIKTDGPITQSKFLNNMGILERMKQLVKNNPTKKESIITGIDRLVSKNHMGELFKVMAFCKKESKDIYGFQ